MIHEIQHWTHDAEDAGMPLGIYSVYFKSESCDDDHFHIHITDAEDLSQNEIDNLVLQWLFEEEGIDGGVELWGCPWNEIPYNTLSVVKIT